MKIITLEFVKYYFVNDVNEEKLVNWYYNTLQPEFTSNTTFLTNYDENIVNTKSIKNLYIITTC